MTRLLIGCGSRTWPDLARAAAELSAYQGWELMHGACPPRRDGTPGGDEALDRAARAMGLVMHRRPANWNGYGDAAGQIRNAEMADEAARGLAEGRWSAVEGLALGALERPDGRRTGTGDMVSLMRARGWPVRWVPAPGAEAQTLALRVWTARIDGQPPDLDDLDITRVGADAAERAWSLFLGAIWAPSWSILRPALDARKLGGEAWAKAWEAYTAAFLMEMRQSFRAHREAWGAMLARDRLVLRCHCRDAARCHRRLLAGRILPRLGALDMGEILPAPRPQLALL